MELGEIEVIEVINYDNGSKKVIGPLVISAILIGIYFIGMIIWALLILPKGAQTKEAQTFAALGGSLVNAGVFIVCLGILFQKMPFEPKANISLRTKGKYFLIGGALLLGANITINSFYMLINHVPEKQDLVQRISNIPTEYQAMIILGTGLIIPLIEEIIFRGFLYNSFTSFIKNGKYKKLIAAVLTASIFALVHLEFKIHILIPLFIMGLIFNYVYEKTGSITVCSGVHALNNMMMLSVLYL
jgi:membrane protease YdiL (CAAX protease family)